MLNCFVLPAFVYIIPIGMIQAITNQQVGLNVITELIIGYALPGRPVAMMMFKTWGYITMAQALTFTSDFKLGHYMKIPPRPMFWGQVVATIIAGTVQLGYVQSSSHHPLCLTYHRQCPGLDVYQYSRDLRSQAKGWFHLPEYRGFWNSINHCKFIMGILVFKVDSYMI